MPIHKDIHASVFMKGPDDTTALIRTSRPRKRSHARKTRWWKFPGGKVNMTEDLRGLELPTETAARETYEETGKIIDPKNLVLLHEEDMGDYSKLYFGISVPSWDGLRVGPSREFEFVRPFKIDTLFWLRPFHERNRRCFVKHIYPRLHEF